MDSENSIVLSMLYIYIYIRITEKWKKCIDDSGTIVAILMDLSEAFHCIPHDLLIAKPHAYGIRINTLELLFSYLTNRKQRVKVNESFSAWVKIIVGVSQGYILGPLLFNIFLNDLFVAIEDDDLCNSADDNTLYKCCKSADEAKQKMESQCTLIIRWFVDNSMKINAEKCHAIVLSKDPIEDNFTVSINHSWRRSILTWSDA